VYDGDGNRVKATIGGVITVYIGNYFEWTGSTSTLIKYFYAGTQRVAMKKGSTVYYLFGDHLGSTAITASSAGAKLGELRYKPWGETRYTWGTTYTNRHFTGQLDETTAIGLYFFNARFYDPLLARFAQADSIVPDPSNPQSFDRFAHARNNPVRFSDPSGYWSEDQLNKSFGKGWRDKFFANKAVFENRNKLYEFLISKNTTDLTTLEIVRAMFNIAYTAHGAGVDFSNIDALGARVTVSAGTLGVVSGSLDVILNLSSGEFGGFISPEGGILIGEGVNIVSGITMYSNMPTNANFRGTSKAVGIIGGDIIGVNGEKSWGGVHYFQDRNDVYDGTYIAIGPAVPELGVYGSLAFAIEALKVDSQGYHWFQNPPTMQEALSDIGEILWHDILNFP